MAKSKEERSLYNKQYYEKNKNKILESVSQYRIKNRENIIEYKKKYREKHRDELNDKQKEYAQSHKEEIAEYKSKYYVEHVENKKQYDKQYNIKPEKRFIKAIGKAKKRKLTWNIDKKTYLKIIREPCFYCNNEIGNTLNNSGIGLDRLDNSIGYEVDNVVSCCYTCNVFRSDKFSSEEIKIAIQSIIIFRKSK